MRLLLLNAACVALVASPAAELASAQAPVREGLRRTGEIAVEGTQRVAEGTGQVLRGAGEAAAGVAQGTVDAGRAVVGGAARGLRAGVDAVTPGIPWQARANANLAADDRGREARWRFSWHNGEWWYYAPESRWMYHRDGDWNEFAQDSFTPNPQFAGQGEYAMGYRGVDEAGQPIPEQYGPTAEAQGNGQRLFVDRYGREYICDNGRPVYVNTQQGFDQQGEPYGAAYRGEAGQQFDAQGNPMTPTPEIPTETGAQGEVTVQGQPAADAAPAVPTPPTGAGVDASAGALAPESPRDINQSVPQTDGTIRAGESAQ